MTDIRFGAIVVPRAGTGWVRAVRAVEEQGIHTLLLPDTLHTASPFPALAAAAAVTSTLRLRPNVLAVPLRTPAAVVRETAALQLLSDGRFELGLGLGRPDAEAEAERLGMPWGSGADRRRALADTVKVVRAEVDPAPIVMVAASGPRTLTAAAEFADRFMAALPPFATESQLARLVGVVRDHTDRPIPFTHTVVGIGDRLSPFLGSAFGMRIEDVRAAGGVGLLPEDPVAAADQLRRWNEQYGIDEIVVPEDLLSELEPVRHHMR
ncbi:LLM class flavin-dependent oxidoreductase [Nocardia terpenica]|uniref:LLM class flavin-dependent oxidoreductase n=1 Tax=Nocardia terpenica TaxID=455432 RepID=UPI001E432B16|nr:LLM class flavin-dependent oxidoreductase [Nocardia terpenica]